MRKPISLFEAALPLLSMLLCLVLGGFFIPMGTELLVLVMLIAATVAGVIAARHGHDWDAIQRTTGEKIATVLPVILILLSIGMFTRFKTFCSPLSLPTKLYKCDLC